MKAIALAILGVTALAAMPASAQPANTCFSMREFQTWKAPDAHTIYVKVAVNHFYRLDLASDCAELQMPGVHLVTKSRGSDQVCDALDWDISASTRQFGQPGGAEMKCIVKTMTPMSAAEVAAIPPKFRP
ncbi:MAG: DUF6491 family protein [Rhizomicrobium sp.]